MNICEMESIFADDRQINLIVLKHERIVRREQTARGWRGRQAQLAVHPWREFEIGIWPIDLNQHRARWFVEGVWMTGPRPVEFLPRKFIDGNRSAVAIL